MAALGVGELPGAVLFACTLNSVRSPMAAAILRHLSANRIYAMSAGARAGDPDAFAIAAMDEIGIDISGHEPIAISQLHDTSFDLIITLSPEAHHQALEFTHAMSVDVEFWPTPDPTATGGKREQILDAYRACRDQLFDRIKTRFALGAGASV